VTLRVRAVSSPSELRTLAPAWDEVLARSETVTPFLTHAWITAWWEAFGADQDLFVLVLEDDTGVAGIAPFARARRSAGPLAYRALELVGTGPLRFLGMGLSDRSDLLLARRREECVAALLERLAAERASWDVVDLRFLPETSVTARVLTEHASAAGLGMAHEPCSDSPYLPLAGSWEDYLALRGKSFRQRITRGMRRLEDAGDVRFEIGAGETDPAAALRASIEVSLESWKERAGSALFLHSRVRDFFEELVPRLAARDGFYAALLRVGGRVAAHELGFRMASKLWSYDSAFRREFAAGSPGTILTAKVLERAWSQGLSEYDFMRGGEGYKTTWTASVRREIQLVLDSGTSRARAARRIAFEAKWALKRRPALVRAQSRLAGIVNRWVERGRLRG
jgi:CelD/BcsL family acetyltransferase involved in cellulose biosynthesis